MNFIIEETTLTDGRTMHNIKLATGGDSYCIFSDLSQQKAEKFLDDLKNTTDKNTLELLEGL